MPRRLLIGLCAAATLAAAAPAQAAVTPSGLTTTASNTGAATRPDFTVSFSMTSSPSGDDAKRLTVDLPPGLLGDVHAISKCSTSSFNGDSCAGATDIGDVSSSVTATVLGLPVPISAPGDIYLLAPQGTEAARMGIVLRPLGGLLGKVYLTASVRVRYGEYGLRATIDNLPRSHSGLPIKITQMSMTLSGSVNGTPFISAPTTCAAAATRVDVLSHDDGQTKSTSASYTPTNCAAVPFAPTASIAVDPAVPDAPAQTSISLSVPTTGTPRIQSHVRSATIALPEGMEVNPAAASGGLEACADGAFAAASSAPAACPDASAVGDITIDNAQLGTLSGGVYLANPQPGQLLRLLIVAQRSTAADDVRVKLTGAVTADPATGRVTAQLDGIPQVPFRSMTMRLRGGQHAILRTPRTCGDTTLGTSLTPWSGGAVATPGATLRLSGCGSDTAPFAPTVGISATPTQAGASGAVDVSITRPDGNARLAGARISLPAGLMGRIAGVPQCPLADARAGSCPAATKVGSATASVGTGPAPLSLPGDLHLTPPSDGGLAGLVLLLDARVGPLDLGRVSVPMELRLRSGGEGIDVTVADIPRRLSGIPLDVRGIALRIDRSGFLLNPTSCAPRTLEATLTSDLGGTAAASAPFQATGCEALAYSPRMRIAFTGEVGKNGHPGVAADLTLPEGQANTQQVGLLLPEGLVPDSERLRNACPLAKAQEGACPASARIGSAVASTPALPDDLRGVVWFVTAPGSVLPELFVRLDGAARIDLRGTVTFQKGRSLVTFAGIPDVPLDSFSLDLSGGRRGVLTTSRDLCTGASPAVDADLRAHSGARRPGKIDPAVDGCRAGTGGAKVTARLARLRSGSPTLRIAATAGDTPLKTVRVTLPKGFRVNTKRVGRLAKVAGVRRTRTTLRAGARTLTLNLGAKGAKRVRVDLRRGALRVTRPALRRAKRVTVVVRATPRSGRPTTLKLKVRPAKR